MRDVKRRVFPETFKREAVCRVETSGLSAGAVARELGLHETVLRRWMIQFATQATGTPRRSASRICVKDRERPSKPRLRT